MRSSVSCDQWEYCAGFREARVKCPMKLVSQSKTSGPATSTLLLIVDDRGQVPLGLLVGQITRKDRNGPSGRGDALLAKELVDRYACEREKGRLLELIDRRDLLDGERPSSRGLKLSDAFSRHWSTHELQNDGFELIRVTTDPLDAIGRTNPDLVGFKINHVQAA